MKHSHFLKELLNIRAGTDLLCQQVENVKGEI